jgi:hypothetical protein
VWLSVYVDRCDCNLAIGSIFIYYKVEEIEKVLQVERGVCVVIPIVIHRYVISNVIINLKVKCIMTNLVPLKTRSNAT